MKCNIIKDLLPLYVEGMVSDDSREAIEDHVKDCAPCRAELEELRRDSGLPPQTDTGALEHLERQIRRRRIHTTILAILATVTVLFGIFQYLYSPIYLSAEEAVADVKQKGDIVIVTLTPEAKYCRWQDSVDPDTGRKAVTFIAARHRWNVLLEGIFGRETAGDDSREMHLAGNKDIWYASTGSGEEDTLLWGQEPSGGRISLPRLVLGYYFWMALAGGTVLLIPALLLRKNRAGKFFGVCALACFSFAVSDLTATGGNWRIYDGYDVPILLTLMLIQTALLTASVLWGIHVRRTAGGE